MYSQQLVYEVLQKDSSCKAQLRQVGRMKQDHCSKVKKPKIAAARTSLEQVLATCCFTPRNH